MADEKTQSKPAPAPAKDDGGVKDLDNGYADVSGAVEAAKANIKDVERDENGIAIVDTSASAAVQAEQSKRAAGSGEGGGRWPADVLRRNYLDPPSSSRPIPEYTSHLDADKS